MNESGECDREMADLRDRLSRLRQASLRMTDSPDCNTVLQGVLDSAQSLTRARYGVMALLDERGRALPPPLASGLTSQEADLLWFMPAGLPLLEAPINISAPLRVPDLMEHVRSLGLSDFSIPQPAGQPFPFLASPIPPQERSVRMGHLYVGGKGEGAEFTQEDEDILVVFASQAAMAIANARRYREERRARVDLETLVDTSPVGVVVFDAETGVLTSLNREARRIVESLTDPGQTAEMLLDVLTFRRADGREISLREFPVAEALRAGETVRSEVIVLAVPDGRTVTVLLNATPILSDAGRVASFVVTMQDMADVRELERMRAEFLAMVSHELRPPLSSIKGSAATALGSASAIDPAVARQFFRIIEDQADRMHDLVSDLLDVARIGTGTLPVSPEPAEVAVLVDQARNAFLSAGATHHLQIDIEPDLPPVLADRPRIVQVLRNLLTNAARYSPASSTITVRAALRELHVAVSVVDKGKGIPAESLPQLFRKFSRKGQPEECGENTSLGLAICEGIVEAHGGRIWGESDGPGLGARFAFTLPIVDQAGSGAAGRRRLPERSSSQQKNGSGERVRVLVVDDDPQALGHASDILTQSGYAPIMTGEPQEALSIVDEQRPQLVLLDLMLPGTDGIDLMQEILELADVPIIFVSAYGREEFVAKALDMGAVDYVVKPFSPIELAARIRTALRQRLLPELVDPYVLGDLTIDFAERTVTLAGRRVELVAMEYRLLAELSANAGRVLTYEQLLRRVWNDNRSIDLRPMRTLVRKLRRKLRDDARDPTYIFTEPRIGYRMPRGESGPTRSVSA